MVTHRRLLTPTDVRRLLREHGLAPRRSAGQNFVVDANTVRRVVAEAGVGPGEEVCEVGPGLGSLTLGLRAAGARVVAVEIDAGLVRALREVVGEDEGVRIVHGDALTVDLSALVGGGPAAFVANLPYHVATPLVFSALECGAFDRGLVMVQREVGRRWAAGVGDELYGAVSVKMAALAEVRVTARISRTAFYPVPNVDSVTVAFAPRPWTADVERPALFSLVEAGFAQRRKRLRNALATGHRSAASVEAALADAGHDPGARAEELSLPGWIELARRLRGG